MKNGRQRLADLGIVLARPERAPRVERARPERSRESNGPALSEPRESNGPALSEPAERESRMGRERRG